jgi:hypothetical protein
MVSSLSDSTPVLTLPKLVIDQERFEATGLAQYISDLKARRQGVLRVVVQSGERRIAYIPRQRMRWSDWVYRFLGIQGYDLPAVVSVLKNTVIPDQYDRSIRNQFVHLVTDYNSRKIRHFGHKISLEKIFRRNIFYLPAPQDLGSLSLTRMHKIWRKNLQTLVGILATEKIPRLGFHGTSSFGLQGIDATHVSHPKYLWVAGINIVLDPITHLADFHRAAQKSLAYSNADGGVFVLQAPVDQCIGKYIHDTSEDIETLRDFDTVDDKKFLHLVHRNTVGEDEHDDRSGKAFRIYGALVRRRNRIPDSVDAYTSDLYHPMDIFTVDEYHIGFSPETYSKVVQGVILNADTAYPFRAPRTAHEYVLQCLAARLRQQEFLLKVFAPYIVWSEKKVREYTQRGEDLVKHIDQSPLFSLRQLVNLRKEDKDDGV